MDLFLKILGIIFLVLILVIVGAAVWLRCTVRQFATQLTNALEGLALSAHPPPRVHLTPEPNPDWQDGEEVERVTRLLRERGFDGIGDYEPEPIFGILLRAFHHTEEPIYAVIYDHVKAGVWIDYVIEYDDGTQLTVSNAPQGDEIDKMPGNTKLSIPGSDARELYSLLLAEREDKPAVPVSAEAFVETFERAYAEEMDWRNLRGGSTDDEIRRVAERSGDELTDETLAVMRRNYDLAAAEGLSVAVRERFLLEAEIDPSVYAHDPDWLIVIHDRMDRATVLGTLESLVWDEHEHLGDDEEPEICAPVFVGSVPESVVSPREVFRQALEHLTGAPVFEKLGEVDRPLPADVYVVVHPD